MHTYVMRSDRPPLPQGYAIANHTRADSAQVPQALAVTPIVSALGEHKNCSRASAKITKKPLDFHWTRTESHKVRHNLQGCSAALLES